MLLEPFKSFQVSVELCPEVECKGAGEGGELEVSEGFGTAMWLV